ncbi:hypothetical protein VTL71DRAFT_1718 [Oculimacula yallundae]|uniref:Uncharacterized protein n=1 Tax=Oculimacula yallundae TaxID=86028 RepID=A0ABR4CDL8_9HELO
MSTIRANFCNICFEASHNTQHCPWRLKSQPIEMDDIHLAHSSPGVLRSQAASRGSADSQSNSSAALRGTNVPTRRNTYLAATQADSQADRGMDNASSSTDNMYNHSNRYAGGDNSPMRPPTSPSAPLSTVPASNSGYLSTHAANNLPGGATQYNADQATQYKADQNMGDGRNLNGQPSSQYLVSPNLNFQTGKDFELRSPPDGALATRRATPEQRLGAYTASDNHATSSRSGDLQDMLIGQDYSHQGLSDPANHYSSAPVVGQASYLFDNQQPLPELNISGMGPDFDFMDYMNSSSPAPYGLPDMSSNAASSLGTSEPSPFNTFLRRESLLPTPQAMDFSTNGYTGLNRRANLENTNQNPRNFEVRDHSNRNMASNYQGYGQDLNHFAKYQVPVARQFVRTFPMRPLPAPPAIEDFENAPALAVLRLKGYAKEVQDYGLLLEQHATRLQPIAALEHHQGARFVWSPDMTFSALLEMPNTHTNMALINNATLGGKLAVRNGVLTRQFGTLLNATADQVLVLAANGQNQSGGPMKDEQMLGSATAFDAMAHLMEERRKGVMNGSIGKGPLNGNIGSMPTSDAVAGEQDDNHTSAVDTPVRGGTSTRGKGRGGAARGGGVTAAKKKATPKRKSDAQDIEEGNENTMGADTGSSAVKPPKKTPAPRKRGPAKKVKSEAAIKNEAAAELINLSMAPQFTGSSSTPAPVVDLERDTQGEVDNQYAFQFEKKLLPRMH